MNIGANIKKLRVNKGLTQKDLADKIGVTYQAVSRWENNEVEPSLDIITKLSEIFKVSVEEIITDKPSTNKLTSTSEDHPVVGVCERCHKAIREGDKFKSISSRGGRYLICDDCYNQDEALRKEDAIKVGIKKRHKGYLYGSLTFVILLVLGIIACITNEVPEDLGILIGFTILAPISGFTLAFCGCVNNNFITNCWLSICSWGFVKFPGVIFTLDWGGIIFFICFKLIVGILAFLIGGIFAIAATLICLFLSIFVFPYAIIVSYKHPEKSVD